MDQTIYALLATVLAAVFALNMQRGIHATERKMVVNEVATQLTGVGVDVLEHVGSTPFDENTDESKKSPLSYPVIAGPRQLTPAAGFGGCVSLALASPSCDDIDDFDGVAVEVEVDGFVYAVDVDVRYVNPDDPARGAGGLQTYAKEVRLTISNPHLLMGGRPLKVDVRRVFTYNRHTS